jgi:hypothetical protein
MMFMTTPNPSISPHHATGAAHHPFPANNRKDYFPYFIENIGLVEKQLCCHFYRQTNLDI